MNEHEETTETTTTEAPAIMPNGATDGEGFQTVAKPKRSRPATRKPSPKPAPDPKPAAAKSERVKQSSKTLPKGRSWPVGSPPPVSVAIKTKLKRDAEVISTQKAKPVAEVEAGGKQVKGFVQVFNLISKSETGSLTIRTLAEKLGIESSAVVGRVINLIQRGCVQRSATERGLIELTPKASNALKAGKPLDPDAIKPE